jgi:hypothetical protein
MVTRRTDFGSALYAGPKWNACYQRGSRRVAHVSHQVAEVLARVCEELVAGMAQVVKVSARASRQQHA